MSQSLIFIGDKSFLPSLFLLFWGHTHQCSGLLGGLQGLYGMPEIEPSSAACKTTAYPLYCSSLEHQKLKFQPCHFPAVEKECL